MEKTLDIIIPVYNVKKYIKRTIDSFKNQNLSKTLFNVYFINDGSTDETKSIIENEIKGFNNLFLINQKNQGAGKARQNGFNKSNGDWILYVDGDGFLSKNYLKSFYKKIDIKYDLIFSDNYRYIYENKKILTLLRGFGQFFINSFYNTRKRMDVGDTTNKLWRRKAIKDVKWSNFKRGEDWIYFAECMKKIRKDAFKRVIFKNQYYDYFARIGSTADLVKKDSSFLCEQAEAHFIAAEILNKTKHSISKNMSKVALNIGNRSKEELKTR